MPLSSSLLVTYLIILLLIVVSHLIGVWEYPPPP